jgi:hypothetical protein
MKKSASTRSVSKKKGAAKARVARTKTKTGSAKAKRPAARATGAATARVTPYTPAPLTGDGWPPFRYPLQ